MGVQVKSKQVVQSIAKPKMKGGVLTEEQKLINEAVAIYSELKELGVDAKMKRLAEIKKIFQERAKEFPQEEEVVFESTEGRMVYSKASITTEVTDKDKMVKALGQAVFNKLANVSMTDLKTYLSGVELEAFTQRVYGSRSCKLIEPKA